jgi:2-succinyl-5-enolpyruvyl-6-hydroxy-3-cyclohexene-1-carboxylate synthase
MISNKTGVQHLAAILQKKGLKYLVISPGSRNAPLINTFLALPDVKCLSIVDERSAAFFALGLAQKSGELVAMTCTSGTAALNYAPAIAEAYYQKIPLIVLTADRPVEWIDQGDGQTINQKNIYKNYIRKSIELPQNIKNADELWYNMRLINQATNLAFYPNPGPVHINLPYSEPLYEEVGLELPEASIIEDCIPENSISTNQKQVFANLLNQSQSVMILAGQAIKNEKLDEALSKLSVFDQWILLSETNANIKADDAVQCIDRVLATIPKGKEKDFAPEVLLTIGGAIVSKKIKAFLRLHRPKFHFHIYLASDHPDTYQCLSNSVYLGAADFFQQIQPLLQNRESNFKNLWVQYKNLASTGHQQFLKDCAFCDLKAFSRIFELLPKKTDLHLANSTPVRYGQLFRHKAGLNHYANRGTSGIDGCISTAAGSAFIGPNLSVVISGDLSFFYDSNALWNNYLSKNLRIIVINNGGGNIFRIIDGPSKTDHLETFFEARHQQKAEGLALAFGLEYFSAENEVELEAMLPKFFSAELQKTALLEIFTNGKRSAQILKDYFRFLATGKE